MKQSHYLTCMVNVPQNCTNGNVNLKKALTYLRQWKNMTTENMRFYCAKVVIYKLLYKFGFAVIVLSHSRKATRYCDIFVSPANLCGH